MLCIRELMGEMARQNSKQAFETPRSDKEPHNREQVKHRASEAAQNHSAKPGSQPLPYPSET
ncbi:hypothetical protein HYALB_00013243 [Hymenoscyphus albidus]|uniref:Uncharacterized protein n=1 Tax=Hymenoscyphus albidus TaxID=595503 RepID=A0A9N9LNA6_9HELO|nr:hypothetical protein HYALB_00013243 [Hymenoscyphus albidus]